MFKCGGLHERDGRNMAGHFVASASAAVSSRCLKSSDAPSSVGRSTSVAAPLAQIDLREKFFSVVFRLRRPHVHEDALQGFR